MYGTLEALGPEHEFCIVDEKLRPLPIVDEIIRETHGRVVNNVNVGKFSFGKELQAHVIELKATEPFKSPIEFEEAMQNGVEIVQGLLEKHHDAHLLGSGMHPLLRPEDAKIWPHRDRQIYEALGRIFNLKQHGWLNIQSFQLNLSYGNERDAVKLHNALTNILPYLPGIAASSPIYEGKSTDYLDNRLRFYLINQAEVPSITGDIIPEYVRSLEEYERLTVEQYSTDLARLSAPKCLLNKKWLNSRGAVIRSDRRAIEIRVLDEQECVKSDVALSCFIRSTLRGMIADEDFSLAAHETLVKNLNGAIERGLYARVEHPHGEDCKQVCYHLLEIASENASWEEKKYLPLVKRRIKDGNPSQLILNRVIKRMQKTDMEEAILDVYSNLADCLEKNRVLR